MTARVDRGIRPSSLQLVGRVLHVVCRDSPSPAVNSHFGVAQRMARVVQWPEYVSVVVRVVGHHRVCRARREMQRHLHLPT